MIWNHKKITWTKPTKMQLDNRTNNLIAWTNTTPQHWRQTENSSNLISVTSAQAALSRARRGVGRGDRHARTARKSGRRRCMSVPPPWWHARGQSQQSWRCCSRPPGCCVLPNHGECSSVTPGMPYHRLSVLQCQSAEAVSGYDLCLEFECQAEIVRVIFFKCLFMSTQGFYI